MHVYILASASSYAGTNTTASGCQISAVQRIISDEMNKQGVHPEDVPEDAGVDPSDVNKSKTPRVGCTIVVWLLLILMNILINLINLINPLINLIRSVNILGNQHTPGVFWT